MLDSQQYNPENVQLARLDRRSMSIFRRINYLFIVISLLIQGCVVTETRKKRSRISRSPVATNRSIPIIRWDSTDAIVNKNLDAALGKPSYDRQDEHQGILGDNYQRQLRSIDFEIELLEDELVGASETRIVEILDKINDLKHRRQLLRVELGIDKPGF